MTPDTNHSADWLNDMSSVEMRRVVDALYRVHQLVAGISDLDSLLGLVMAESKSVARAEACSLMLYDESTEQLFFSVAFGESGDQQALKREVRLGLDEGIAGAAAKERRAINVSNVKTDTRWKSSVDKKIDFDTRSLLAVPLVDKDKLIGVVEVINKIGSDCFTDADRHIMEMFASLAARIIDNARLIEDNLQAERLAAIGQTVAGLSHYTKNVITSLEAGMELVEQGLEEERVDLLRKSWPIFKRSTLRISKNVEDMLAYSKARQPCYVSSDLKETVDDVCETFWGLLSRKSVKLEVDLDGVEKDVLIDTQGLFRCLLNLLTNASDAVENETGVVCLSARILENGSLQIDVSDNGAGIPEEDIGKIFDPFFSTKGSKGTGLGLAVVHKIVLEHQGSITPMQSEQGGALFRIVLPQDVQGLI